MMVTGMILCAPVLIVICAAIRQVKNLSESLKEPPYFTSHLTLFTRVSTGLCTCVGLRVQEPPDVLE